jgi:beta-xylosidase
MFFKSITADTHCKRVACVCLVMTAVATLSPLAAAESPQGGLTPAKYSNPILTENNPADPDVIRYEDKYYLYATSHGRGYDVYVSSDLVNWKKKGLAFSDPRGGAWAPDLFRYERGDGEFYLYYTVNSPDPGRTNALERRKLIGVATSESPLGPFHDQKTLVVDAIDAHVFEDSDGKLYFYYVDISNGFRIMGQAMSDPLTLSGKPVELLRPTEAWEKASGHVTEGPFMLHRNGVYYLMYSGSGADSPQYAIGYATSRSPLGPFVKYEKNPIASRTDSVIGPGHHCVVETPDGDLWMIYHQKWNSKISFRRFLALDRMWFDRDGALHARVTNGTVEIAPAKKSAE